MAAAVRVLVLEGLFPVLCLPHGGGLKNVMRCSKRFELAAVTKRCCQTVMGCWDASNMSFSTDPDLSLLLS